MQKSHLAYALLGMVGLAQSATVDLIKSTVAQGPSSSSVTKYWIGDPKLNAPVKFTDMKTNSTDPQGNTSHLINIGDINGDGVDDLLLSGIKKERTYCLLNTCPVPNDDPTSGGFWFLLMNRDASVKEVRHWDASSFGEPLSAGLNTTYEKYFYTSPNSFKRIMNMSLIKKDLGGFSILMEQKSTYTVYSAEAKAWHKSVWDFDQNGKAKKIYFDTYDYFPGIGTPIQYSISTPRNTVVQSTGSAWSNEQKRSNLLTSIDNNSYPELLERSDHSSQSKNMTYSGVNYILGGDIDVTLRSDFMAWNVTLGIDLNSFFNKMMNLNLMSMGWSLNDAVLRPSDHTYRIGFNPMEISKSSAGNPIILSYPYVIELGKLSTPASAGTVIPVLNVGCLEWEDDLGKCVTGYKDAVPKLTGMVILPIGDLNQNGITEYAIYDNDQKSQVDVFEPGAFLDGRLQIKRLHRLFRGADFINGTGQDGKMWIQAMIPWHNQLAVLGNVAGTDEPLSLRIMDAPWAVSSSSYSPVSYTDIYTDDVMNVKSDVTGWETQGSAGLIPEVATLDNRTGMRIPAINSLPNNSYTDIAWTASTQLATGLGNDKIGLVVDLAPLADIGVKYGGNLQFFVNYPAKSWAYQVGMIELTEQPKNEFRSYFITLPEELRQTLKDGSSYLNPSMAAPMNITIKPFGTTVPVLIDNMRFVVDPELSKSPSATMNCSNIKPWDDVQLINYKEGTTIKYGNKAFQCREWPASIWCSNPAYIPEEKNADYTTGFIKFEVWPQAWIKLGDCQL